MSDETKRLTIGSAEDGEGVVLVLAGEIDPHTAPALAREVVRVLDADAKRLVFDLEAVRFIDSSGLRVFISAHRQVTQRGGSFLLRSPTQTTVRLLEVTGLDRHIDVES